MIDPYESASKMSKKKRKQMEDIYNYVPEDYSSSKKRFIEFQHESENPKLGGISQQDQNEKIVDNTKQSLQQQLNNVQAIPVQSYYEKVYLSSEKKRRNLEEGEVQPGSSKKKNKRQKRKALKEKLQNISKQLHLSFHSKMNNLQQSTETDNKNDQKDILFTCQNSQGNVSYAEYLKNKQNNFQNITPQMVQQVPKGWFDSKLDEKIEEKFKSMMKDHNMSQYDQKKQYINEPFPEVLTPQEQLELLKIWRQRNFMDMNTWIQKSGAKLSITYQNDCQDDAKSNKKKQIFHCFMNLKFDLEEIELEMQKQTAQYENSILSVKTQEEYFNNKNHNIQLLRKLLNQNITIQVSSFAENKKEAKKRAFENLFKEIANRNLLCLGIRYKSYLDYVLTFQDVPNNSNLFHDLYRQQVTEDAKKDLLTNQDKIDHKLHKYSKKIQIFIQKDQFEEACKQLQKISEFGKIEWRWVGFLWAYCIKRKKPAELKYLIDIMQSRQLKKQESEEEYYEEIKIKYHNSNEPIMIGGEIIFTDSNQLVRESVNRILRQQYRDVVRFQSENPFDYYDKFNLEVSDEQMPAQNMVVDIPEPIPRIFNENLNEVLQQSYSIPIKSNKPMYNYYHHLTFAGSYMSQPSNQYQLQQQQRMSLDHLNKMKGSQPFDLLAEKKDPFTNYLSIDMLNQMYETLIYSSSDPEFALQVCEIIYKFGKIDVEQFINSSCAFYFTNKKLQIVQEMIEIISNTIYTNKSMKSKQHQYSQYITNIKGSIKEIGTLYEKDVFIFSPKENAGILEKKLLKRNQSDGTIYHHQICEDEMVVLSCFFKPSYDKPFMKATGDKLIDYFNANSRRKDGTLVGDEEQPQIIENGKSKIQVQISDEEYSYSKAYVDSITEYGNKVEYSVIAYVKEIQKDLCMKLYILNPDHKILSEQRTWKITKICNLGLYERYNDSLLKTVTKSDSMSKTINRVLTAPPLSNIYHLRSLAETIVDKEMPIQNKDLNPSQYQALLAAHRQSLSLIQAPNGSGKMRVLKRLIMLWAQQNSKLKILLCVHSTERMRQVYHALRSCDINAIEVSEKQTTKLEFTGLKTSVPDYEKTHNSMPRYYHSLKKALLGAQVVITNCSSANFSVLKGIYFQKVIILDAENVSEIACLEAITKQCQQLVLIGDHLQQIAYTNNLFSSSRGFGLSLFERLVREGIRPFLLCQNYKISFHILQFTSKYYYKNLVFPTPKLKDEKAVGAEEEKQSFMEEINQIICEKPKNNLDNYCWPNNQVRINFIHVEGFELKKGDSIVNVKELEVLIHTILYLFKCKAIRKEQLCIVTPYKTQKQLILSELDYHVKNNPQLFDLDEMEALNVKSSMDVINVKTVEELDKRFDFIVYSTVRSNKEGKLGSLRDPRRINAVVSRTNEAIIVIGDVFTLDNEQIWREFIQWCRDRGLMSQYFS
ncbi:hypothetical protein ABPG74_003978 [Tetrahymena malaccensis]